MQLRGPLRSELTLTGFLILAGGSLLLSAALVSFSIREKKYSAR
jgi:hypothetical protein